MASYYTKLYTLQKTDPKTYQPFTENIQKEVTNEQNQALTNKLTLNELYTAVKSFPPNKSPGVDGLPAEFYSVFFELIKENLLALIVTSFETGALPESAKTGAIVRIPKKGDKKNLNN